MPRSLTLLFAVTLLHLAPVSRASAQSAEAVLDTAIARMGGTGAVRGIRRARFEMMTQWQRTAFDPRPYNDQPSYESHTDMRDYDLSAWRNTRRFNGGRTTIEVADIVRDTIAIRRSPGGPGGVASPAVVAPGTWGPLNIAYVQEKRELFAFAPDRALVLSRTATDLRVLGDTTIAGARYQRVKATIDGFATTLVFRRSTGFLVAATFRTAELNDFGLAPWGEMDVEFWYSAWRKLPDGLVYPYQWDVRRVGKPYKRMTLLAAAFNPPATPDSFAVSDSLRQAYLATATRPMHDVQLDSARITEGRFAWFGAPGAPAGAVKLGAAWVLLETGQASLSAERASAWLRKNDNGAVVSAALVTMPATGNGGAAWFAKERIPVHVASGAAPFIDAVFDGHGINAKPSVISTGKWIRSGGDSLWVESIDLPDAPGTMVAWVPTLKWMYSLSAASPLHLDRMLAHARARKWQVSRFGSVRAVATALSAAQQLP